MDPSPAKPTALAALAVFLGGASYGFMAPLTKSAYAVGVSWQEATAGQEVFGAALFAVALVAMLIVNRLRGRRSPIVKLTPKQILKLMGVGACTCGTCFFYSHSLALLPVAGAITMLFQFTWIGVVIQVIVTRRPPRGVEVAAAAVVVIGTLLASGLVGGAGVELDPLGIVYGLASAVTCATFMFLTGSVETEVPLAQRGFVICLGAAIVSMLVCPWFFPAGVALGPLLPYGLGLGLTALFLPVFLFAYGTGSLPVGVSTVLASAELPCSLILTFFIVGEGLTALQGVGIVAIMAGIVISQLPAQGAGQLARAASEKTLLRKSKR